MTTEFLEIQSATKRYMVTIGEHAEAIHKLTAQTDTFFVVDTNVYHLHNDLFKDISAENLYLLEAVEANKTIQTALDICERVTSLPAKRNAVLVSFGGGITQDITGFAANILYRGIRWIFVPTTLLAACDSCIGGKASLNYKGYKNLLGTFYPPDEVCIYTPFFETLSRRDLLSGLGEIVKFNLIQDEQTLDSLEKSIHLLLAGEIQTVNRFVLSSLAFKRHFIEADEFDRGERIKLNFAHTFGHAYEVESGYKVPRGMAVSMGMITANFISVRRGLLSQQLAKRMEAILLSVIEVGALREPFSCEVIVSAIHKDKKQIDQHIIAILLSENFALHIVHDISIDEICEAVKYLSDRLIEHISTD